MRETERESFAFSRVGNRRDSPMATAFLALRCYACGMFQVKQQKKSGNKWCCCICNEKQSVCKVYGRSAAAKDMRKLVQGLNITKLDEDASFSSGANEELDQEMSSKRDEFSIRERPSKWNEFLDREETSPGVDGDDNSNYVTVFPESRGRKRGKGLNACSSRKAQSRETTNRCSSGSLRQLGMGAFFKADAKQRGKDLKQEEIAAEKENLWSTCEGSEDSVRKRYTRERPQEESRDKYAGATMKTVSKWNVYLNEDVKEEPAGSSRSRSSVYGKWSSFQPQEYASPSFVTGTELEDEIVTEDVHPSFL